MIPSAWMFSTVSVNSHAFCINYLISLFAMVVPILLSMCACLAELAIKLQHPSKPIFIFVFLFVHGSEIDLHLLAMKMIIAIQ